MSTSQLFTEQVDKLQESHFLVLYWAAMAEGKKHKYNITNCFDDLKQLGITRTKQNAVALAEALAALCFVDFRDEGNRRNIYITRHGAKALEALVLKGVYNPRNSPFLEGN